MFLSMMLLWFKDSRPNSVNFLKWTLTYELYVVECGSKNGH